MANRQMEIPVHNNGVVTSRSLNQNSSENSNIFLPEQEKQLAELKKRLVELKIRFDTNPNYYQKNDYKELINLIASSLIYLYSDASHAEIITSWEQVVADDTIPSSKLVNDTFELVDMTINSHYSALVEML